MLQNTSCLDIDEAFGPAKVDSGDGRLRNRAWIYQQKASVGVQQTLLHMQHRFIESASHILPLLTLILIKILKHDCSASSV